MRAVLLGFLRHQTDVLNGACGRRIKLAGFLEVVDRLVIDARIGIVGDDTVGVGFLAVRAPAFAACADQRGHGGVDDHIRRNVQVGDATVAVDHIHRRALGHDGVDGGLDLGIAFDAGQQIA